MHFKGIKIFSFLQVKSFFSSPFFLALVISDIIYIFLTPIEKYKLELCEEYPVEKKGGNGTNRGFAIIKQIFDLYYKLTGVKIHYTITDLNQNHSAAQGTRVEVVIGSLKAQRVTHPLHKN